MYPGLVLVSLSLRASLSIAQGACSYTSPAPVFRRLIVCVFWPFPLLFLCFFFATGATSSAFSPSLCSAPAAARAAPPSPSIAAPVCPVPDCVFAAAAAVAVCPVCSSSSRGRFFVAGVDAAPAVSLLAAAPDLLLLAPSLRCAVAAARTLNTY